MELFWEQGFHATSTKELAERMEINSYSLFAEFGSKQGLYESAMELYDQEIVTKHFGRLEREDSGLRELKELFDMFASAAEEVSRKGCMLCNTATERGPFDPASQRVVNAYVDRIQDSVSNALQNAREAGELREDVDVDGVSAFLTTALLGFWVLLRPEGHSQRLHSAAREAGSYVEQLRRA